MQRPTGSSSASSLGSSGTERYRDTYEVIPPRCHGMLAGADDCDAISNCLTKDVRQLDCTVRGFEFRDSYFLRDLMVNGNSTSTPSIPCHPNDNTCFDTIIWLKRRRHDNKVGFSVGVSHVTLGLYWARTTPIFRLSPETASMAQNADLWSKRGRVSYRSRSQCHLWMDVLPRSVR